MSLLMEDWPDPQDPPEEPGERAAIINLFLAVVVLLGVLAGVIYRITHGGF